MNEVQLLESKELRDNLAERYEVLEKVKQLLLIPNTEFATTKQVAEFYEVNEESIQKIIQRHSEEIIEDGLLKLSGSETKGRLGMDIMSTQNFRGGFSINGIIFNNRSNTLFPRRAILRVGMLLRDSEIAKEVRTQLLNIEEKSSAETKVQDVNEEQGLALSLGMAIASGNLDAILQATGKMMDFKNRHITKLETDNRALAGDILEWGDRSKINAGIRKLASVTGTGFAQMWNMLYRELQYKYGIQLKKRGDSPYIRHIRENEWTKVLKAFAAICESYNQSPTDMIQMRVMA